jgi:hypothetical protein
MKTECVAPVRPAPAKRHIYPAFRYFFRASTSILICLVFAMGGTSCFFVHSLPNPYPTPHPNPNPNPHPIPEAPPVSTPDPGPAPIPKPAPTGKHLAYHAPTVVPTDCPVAGSAVASKAKTANAAKNRTTEPGNYDFIPIDSLLDASRDDYSQDQGIYTEGFISDLKHSSAETCNCGSKTDSDIHIELVPTLDDIGDNSKKMIVEITPRMQINFTFSQLKRLRDNKIKIRVFGWLFFDNEHVGAKWRGTEWEIHPITDIEIVD